MTEPAKTQDVAQRIEIRALNTADFWAILNILKKGGKEAFSKMKEAGNDDNARAFVILDVGMDYAQKELSGFLASLAGMDPDEYNKAPFDTTLSIIEQLEEKEDLGNFFERVANLAAKFSPKKKKTA